MNNQTDIGENGATRLIAALAAQEVRDVLEGKGDVELAKKSLQLLLEIIAGAVPNVPTSDIKELAKPDAQQLKPKKPSDGGLEAIDIMIAAKTAARSEEHTSELQSP